MDIIGNYTAGTDGVTASSVTFTDWPLAGDQASGDMLVVAVCNDGGGTTLAGMTGWTESGTQQSNAGCRTAIWYRIHTGTEITAPTITGAASEEYAACMVHIRPGPGGTLAVDVSADTQQTANTQDPTAPSVTTTGPNRMLLHIVGRDASGTCLPAGMIGRGTAAARRTDSLTGTTVNAECQIFWTVAPTAGATDTFAWRSSVSDGGRQTTIAISDSSGHIPAYTAASGIQVINDWSTSPTLTLLSALHASINGVTTAASDTTGGAARNNLAPQDTTSAILGLYGWYRGMGQIQTATTGLGDRMYGVVATITSTDFTDGLFLCDFRYSLTAANSAIQDQGYYLYFRDGAGGWCIVRPIATERLAVLQSYRPHVLYLPSLTQIAGSGTINWANVVGFGPCIHVTTTTGTAANREYLFRPLLKIPFSAGYVTFCGGTSSDPFGLRVVTDLLRSSGYPYQLPSINGSKLNYCHLPIRIGNGGTNPTHFAGNSNAFEFVDSSSVGIVTTADDLEFAVKLGASDTFSLGAALVGCGTAQKFTIESGSSPSATMDWGGTFFGMTPVLNGIPTDGVAYTGCAEIDAGTNDIDGISVKGTVSTDAAIAFTGGSLTNSTIDVTGTSAAYHIELGTAVTAFTLTNVTLAGTPGTDKVHVKRTTGTVTITAVSTALTASDVTSDGAAVTVVSGATLTISANVSLVGAEVRIYDLDNTPAGSFGTELAGTESAPGATYAWTYNDFANTVRVQVLKSGYEEFGQTIVTPSFDSTLSITLFPDSNA